jgi:hypothetical protein
MYNNDGADYRSIWGKQLLNSQFNQWMLGIPNLQQKRNVQTS